MRNPRRLAAALVLVLAGTLAGLTPASGAVTRDSGQGVPAEPRIEIRTGQDRVAGLFHEVGVRTYGAPGQITLTLDGRPQTPSIASGPDEPDGYAEYELSASLPPGRYTLRATVEPSAPGEPVLSTELDYRIDRQQPVLVTEVSRRVVTQGRTVRVRARLASLGFAPRTGKVVVRDGRRVVGRITLRTTGVGKRPVVLRLHRVGKHRLTATFLGNSHQQPARSTVTVKVRRR